MAIVKFLAAVAFLASVVWFYFDPDYEPGIAAVTSLSTLICLWIRERQSQSKVTQSQAVGDGGVAVQAVGDATVGNIQSGGGNNVK